VKVEESRNRFFKMLLGKKMRFRKVRYNESGPWWDEIRAILPTLEARKLKIEEADKRQAELDRFAKSFKQ
jgi:hypothetical protein